MWSAVPAADTSRAGRLRCNNHRGAALPATIDAVEAVFAATHDAPATEIVRQGPSAGLPVRGSMMWCIRWPLLVQRR